MADIALILNQVMAIAIENGANSISMPDEYVSVAHFVCFPEQYYIEVPNVQVHTKQNPAETV